MPDSGVAWRFFRCVTPCLLCFALCACTDKDTSRPGSLIDVTVVEMVPQRVPVSAELSGRVNAFRKAEVRPQVSGILVRQLFKEGSLVSEGQSLYKIDPATYEAAVESARAEVSRGEARLHAATLTRDRRRALLRVNAVSRQAFEDADAEYLQAKADLDAAKAALKASQIQLRYTDVLAPISGRIGKSSVTQGALVTANQAAPMAVIQQLDPVYVDMTRSILPMLQLRELYSSGSLKPPQNGVTPVRLILENHKSYPLEGEMQFADITVDESTGMVLLRAVFPNPEGLLLPGMYVRAMVEEGIEEKALLVPQLAVRRNAKGQASVFVLEGDDTVNEREVEASERVGSDWLIRQGLTVGEKVVIKGMQRLRHGSKVKAQLVSVRQDASNTSEP
ncbi:MAG: efflux RND transporter periplasmic adaptor subunit [Desulfovibrio sp.]|nr:efflux RND transporter periplasmic adaptor subunit [Desulfovibrio sp.]